MKVFLNRDLKIQKLRLMLKVASPHPPHPCPPHPLGCPPHSRQFPPLIPKKSSPPALLGAPLGTAWLLPRMMLVSDFFLSQTISHWAPQLCSKRVSMVCSCKRSIESWFQGSGCMTCAGVRLSQIPLLSLAGKGVASPLYSWRYRNGIIIVGVVPLLVSVQFLHQVSTCSSLEH